MHISKGGCNRDTVEKYAEGTTDAVGMLLLAGIKNVTVSIDYEYVCKR
jgi:hypothetical protein